MRPDARDPSLDDVRQELRQEIHASVAELRQEIQASATETRQYVDVVAGGLREGLRQEIQISAAETRRYFDVIAEGLRSDIRLLAEGLGTLDQKVERFRDEVREEFHKVDRRLLRLEAESL